MYNIYISALANPTFQKLSCEFVPEPNNYDLCLHVDYPDKTDDMLLLRNVHGEDTVFQGHLFLEKTSVCAVIQDASNPDDMEVKKGFVKKNLKLSFYLIDISITSFKISHFSMIL